jgi:hypothetical protein
VAENQRVGLAVTTCSTSPRDVFHEPSNWTVPDEKED